MLVLVHTSISISFQGDGEAADAQGNTLSGCCEPGVASCAGLPRSAPGAAAQDASGRPCLVVACQLAVVWKIVVIRVWG